jgi:hypothetical protein
MNDIPRHLCTVSRDITIGALGGFEPATYRLGVAEPPLICDLCGHRGARRSAGTLPWWSVTRPPIHSVPSRRSTSRRLSQQAWEIRALTEAGADAIITSMAELEVHCLQGRRAYRRCDFCAVSRQPSAGHREWPCYRYQARGPASLVRVEAQCGDPARRHEPATSEHN